jgi:hypothetical protein
MKFVAHNAEKRDYLERIVQYNEAMTARESEKQRRRHRIKTKSGGRSRNRRKWN